MKNIKLFIFGLEKYLGIVLILFLAIFAKILWQPPFVFGETTEMENPDKNEVVAFEQSITTKSSFTQKLKEETEIIANKTVYQDDPEIDAGEEKILEEGADGKIIKTIKIIFHQGKEFNREVVDSQTLPPVDKKILRGTRVVWRTADTPEGQIKYWKKMRVYATHYDSHCLGCDQWTATGMRQGKGVIAVDPRVIPLRSKVYVPGYGSAIAGDTGGAIKGKIIDLGFEDARTAGWSARYVEIYLL